MEQWEPRQRALPQQEECGVGDGEIPRTRNPWKYSNLARESSSETRPGRAAEFHHLEHGRVEIYQQFCLQGVRLGNRKGCVYILSHTLLWALNFYYVFTFIVKNHNGVKPCSPSHWPF